MEDYQAQQEKNRDTFMKGMNMIRPDLYSLVVAMDSARVDPVLLTQVIYALERICDGKGTKYGEVRIFIENGIATFVRGEASKKVNIPVLKQTNE